MAWLLNLLLPGAGLILRRHEWVGFLLALVFGLCGNVALAGVLIAPEAVPAWLRLLAGICTGLIWLVAQLLLWKNTHDGQPVKNESSPP